MVEVGQTALKIAGRDAGKVCVVVEVLDNNYVLVDGETRRRKCNVRHLEFLGKKVKVKKNADSEDVRKALKEAGIAIAEVEKGKKKEKGDKPVRFRKSGMKESSSQKKSKEKK